MFGLSITEKHDGYIGHRAIFTRGYIDVLPNRGSMHGSKESVDRVIAWASKERKLPPHPGKKRLRKITPWSQMLEEAPKKLSSSSRDNWEICEGDFVLRCKPNAYYGYLYIALFEKSPELQPA